MSAEQVPTKADDAEGIVEMAVAHLRASVILFESIKSEHADSIAALLWKIERARDAERSATEATP